MKVSLLTHICATRPQWAKDINYHFFLNCTIYSLPVHMYRWCMYSFLSFNPYFCLLYRHLPLVTITPQNTTYWTLSCLAIYSNLKLLINFLFCIIQKRAIKFWGEHFSIHHTITARKCDQGHYQTYPLDIEFIHKICQGEGHLIPRKMLTNSFYLKILRTSIWTQKYIVFGDLQIRVDCLVSENVIRWMPQGIIDNKLTLVHVMAWCSQASTGLILFSCCSDFE